MRDHADAIRSRGAELVIVGNGAAHFAAAFRADFALEGPLLIDPELAAYRAAGLRRGRVEALSPRLAFNAVRALRKGFTQSEVQGDAWQLGGAFVIQRGGRLTYAHRSGVAGDHAPVEALIEALDEGAAEIEEGAPPPRSQVALGRVLGAVIDPFIVGSFDRTGFRIHSLTFDPGDLDVDLQHRRCLVTGANSGIGFETARALADLGAEVVLLCRNGERGRAAAEQIVEATGNRRVSVEVVDLSDLASVRAAALRLRTAKVDVLVHNAGVLPDDRIETADGLELTFATHVAGPFLLTRLLEDALAEAGDARVVWVSSGGMYTQALEVDDPGWLHRDYDGVTAYAETKRAQVVLSELWAERLRARGITVNAMHPGWADTPAVETSLPRFHRLTRAILRTPAEGADTVVWLAASRRAGEHGGRFYFDREPRRTHLLPWTRETPAQREALWALCERICAEGGLAAAEAEVDVAAKAEARAEVKATP